MGKKNKIMSLINEIAYIGDKKKILVKEQRYNDASALRDEEKKLLNKLDKVTGVDNFYSKVFTSEKILKHFEIITNSMNELKRMGVSLDQSIDTQLFNKMEVRLLKERNKAYETVFNLNKIKNNGKNLTN